MTAKLSYFRLPAGRGGGDGGGDPVALHRRGHQVEREHELVQVRLPSPLPNSPPPTSGFQASAL